MQRITWDPIAAEKGGFKHYMLKEIYEQPRAVRDTIIGRVSQTTGRVYLDEMEISEADRDIAIIAAALSCSGKQAKPSSANESVYKESKWASAGRQAAMNARI